MTTIKTTTALCAIAAVLALGACQRNSETDQTAGQRVDSTMADAKSGASEMKSDIGKAAEAVGDKAKDVSITTAVNAELARDPQLSSLKINVDTLDGKVVLRGTAPNEAARERATSLATSVSGVLGVDNQLTVNG